MDLSLSHHFNETSFFIFFPLDDGFSGDIESKQNNVFGVFSEEDQGELTQNL